MGDQPIRELEEPLDPAAVTAASRRREVGLDRQRAGQAVRFAGTQGEQQSARLQRQPEGAELVLDAEQTRGVEGYENDPTDTAPVPAFYHRLWEHAWETPYSASSVDELSTGSDRHEVASK